MASSNLQEASREASEYLESVMVLQQFAEVKSPFHVSSGRKRHLSLPDGYGVKKLKNDSALGSRDMKKARRTLYESNTGYKQIGYESDATCVENWKISEDLSATANQSENTNPVDPGKPEHKKNQLQAASKGDSCVKPKTKGKGKSDKSSDGSGMAQLVSAFHRTESRYSKMEQTMEKKFKAPCWKGLVVHHNFLTNRCEVVMPLCLLPIIN